jgi:hypothetical protein
MSTVLVAVFAAMYLAKLLVLTVATFRTGYDRRGATRPPSRTPGAWEVSA